MLHLLGIDHEQLTFKFQGRDFRLTDVHGHVVKASWRKRVLTELQPFLGRFHPLAPPSPDRLPAAGRRRRGPVATEALRGHRHRAPDADAARPLRDVHRRRHCHRDAAVVERRLRHGARRRHQQWGLMLGTMVFLACVAAWWRERTPGGYPACCTRVVSAGRRPGRGDRSSRRVAHARRGVPDRAHASVPFLMAARASTPRGPVDPSATPVFKTLVAPRSRRGASAATVRPTGGQVAARLPGGDCKGGEDGAVIVPGNAAGSFWCVAFSCPLPTRR